MSDFFQSGAMSVLVLRGGPGSEREVSLKSGAAVAGALRQAGCEVREADIGPDHLDALDGSREVVFPVVHGTFGEDGQLQGILERRRLRYVGSDAASSHLAMDKFAAKRAFVAAGLYSPPARLLFGDVSADQDARIEAALDQVGVPVVVKPNCEGSSIGIGIAREREQARAMSHDVLGRFGDCLLERFVLGRELTLGILEGHELPLLEVCPAGGFYDYEAKYQVDTTEYRFDIDLPREVLAGAGAAARGAFYALGCRDFGRVDLIVDAEGRAWILEVNTLPGFTDHSLLPKAGAAIGMDLPGMCAEIVRLGAARSI